MHLEDFLSYAMTVYRGIARVFLKGGSNSSIELPEAEIWGHSPQPLRETFNILMNLNSIFYANNSTLIIMHSYMCPWDEACTIPSGN